MPRPPRSDGSPWRNATRPMNERRKTDDDQAVAERGGLGLSRPVLTRAAAEREPGAQVEVTVILRIGRRTFNGSSRGIGHETIELRTAAEATMAALHDAIGDRYFDLVGIKRMHAFDADVVLVALRDHADATQRFIGAVPVRSTLAHAAAAAVLDATNRILTRPAD